MLEIKKSFGLIAKVDNLEKQVSILESKVQESIKHIEFLTAENKRLESDTKLLEEENKRLQGLLKGYSSLQSKTDIVKLKIKQLVKRISQVV